MKKKKYILTKLEYLKTTKENLEEMESFNEALRNEITWGDSLVGRLLASIFRMAKMGSNIVSVKRYINQLDNIISEGITKKLIENDSSVEEEIIEFQNSSIKNGILEGMEEDPENSAKIIKDYKETYGKESVEEIIESLPEELKTILKQVTIKSAENIQEESSEEIHKLVYTFLKNLKESIDKKNSLNNQDYKIFKSLQDNNITDKKTIDEYNNIIKGLRENTELNKDEDFLNHLSINNRLDILSYTEKVLEEYKKVLGDNAENFNEVEEAKEYFESLKNYYNNLIHLESKSLVKMFLEKSEKVANIKLTVERHRAPYLIKNDEKDISTKQIDIDFSDPLFQPMKIEYRNFDKVINNNETHLEESYNNLVDSISYMESGKDKYPVTSEFVGELISDFETKKEDRKYFYELFYMICDYLDGVRTGVSEPSPLYEAVEEFNSDSNKGTMSKIAETIARFLKRSEQFKGEGLYGAMGDLGKHISAVNNSIDTMKVEYQLNGIRIDNDDKEKVDTSKVEFSSKDKITKIDGEEVDWKTYRDDDEEIIQRGKDIVKKTEKEVEKIKNEGFDVNFIKVLRVFQKAHRIMVVNNIPSVRSGGKMTVQRSNNWEPLGNNSVSIDGSSSGPFRNKKLFNIWNKGVLDIIDKYQDSLKYASLVADKANETTTTVIKRGDGTEQTISKAKDTAVRLKPKTTLLEFMASALDDNKLFASIGGAGGEGYQAKYLKAYMGYDSDTKSSIGKDVSTYNKEEETKWVSSSGFNISYNPYRIMATIVNEEDGVKRPFEMYLLPITSRDGKYLYKMSQSDDFLESYLDNYRKRGPNAESGGDTIRFAVFDSKNHNIKYGESSEPFKYVKAKDWADGTVFTGYITDIKKIDRYQGNAKWNGDKKDYDVYPSKQSIDELIKKLS